MNLFQPSTFLFTKTHTTWPTKTQELLIRAAILSGNEAIDAWQEWTSIVAINEIDDNSRILLPLLYKNLRNHNINDPSIGIYKREYRTTWFKTNLLYKNAALPLQSFQNAGIRTMLIKGAALTTLYYKDLGLRPKKDVDVLVHPDDASASFDLLEKLGWRPMEKVQKSFENKYLSFSSSRGFENNSGFAFDLNWHLIKLCCEADADDSFWKGAFPIQFQDMPVLVLNPTDQLMHVCFHGMTHIPMSPKWIADAIMIINYSGSEIDWDRLLAQVQERHIVLHLNDTLAYLHNRLNASIPERVLRKLSSIQISGYEQMEYHATTGLTKQMGSLPRLWFFYRRHSSPKNNTNSDSISFYQYLRYIWGLEQLWKVPFQFVFKVIKRGWKLVFSFMFFIPFFDFVSFVSFALFVILCPSFLLRLS
ncbi:MAG: nucleotidyltransferase family protein [Anaerolineales bacterium]